MTGDHQSRRRGLRLRKPEDSSKSRLGSPVVQIAFFFGFLVAVVLLTTLNLGVSSPTLSESSIGVPADADIRATRDYTYEEVDERASARRRDEAAKKVPSVYDHHIEYREQLLDKVRRAFGDARRSLMDAEKAWTAEKTASAPKPPPPNPEIQGDPAPAPELAAPLRKPPTEEEVRAFRVKTAEQERDKFDLGLQTIISDEDFARLAEDGFSPTSQEALEGMINHVMLQRVVPNLRLLEAEGRRGVTLRRVHTDEAEQIHTILDFSQGFLDAGSVQREISRHAPQLLRGLSDAPLRRALIQVASQLATPNTTYNHPETERLRSEARDAQDDLRVVLNFRKGQIIVDRGHIVTERHVRIVEQMEGSGDLRVTLAQVMIGTMLVILSLLVVMYIFSRATIRKFKPEPRDLILIGSVVVFVLAMLEGTRLALISISGSWSVLTPDVFYYGVPLALGAMIVRMVLNSETALVYSIIIAVLSGLALDQSLTFAVFALVTSLAGARAVGKICQRMDLVKAGVWVGGVNVVMVLAVFLLQGQVFSTSVVWALLSALLSGALSGVLVNAVLPLVENLFRYTTDIKLLELADLNHPALKELIMKAPGTYHHSVMVGTLAKEAAEAISANPLLARVGAYYHDIGKGKNPQYFAENQRSGQNPHDKLKPNMSALIIKSHVKDGLELARHYNLPQEIQEFIAMHHGTTLIAYFYHRAKSMEDPDIPEVDEKDYRYPGPRPQTRETAIVMLADGIEAASRAMPDPSPARLKGLVQTMINKLFADGQLDDCDLTLKDLNAIAKAFIRVLTSMYYTRPQYPGQEKNPGAKASAARKAQATGETRRNKDNSSTSERKRNKPQRTRSQESRARKPKKEPRTKDAPLEANDLEATHPGPPIHLSTTGNFTRQDLLLPELPRDPSSASFAEAMLAEPRTRPGAAPYIRMTGTMVAISSSGKDEEDVLNQSLPGEGEWKLAEDAEMCDDVPAKRAPNPNGKTPPEPHSPQETEHAAGTGTEPSDRGDDVGGETQPGPPPEENEPSLRRLGLS